MHAVGNMVVSALCLPDFFYISQNPFAALSVPYCESLQGLPGIMSTLACSELPTALIVSHSPNPSLTLTDRSHRE